MTQAEVEEATRVNQNVFLGYWTAFCKPKMQADNQKQIVYEQQRLIKINI